MTEQYKHLTDYITTRYQLTKICQKTKETLPQYYERYKALTNRAYVGVQHESCVRDTMVDYFIEGIPNIYIKRYAREMDPTSLTHACKLANEGQKVNVQMQMGNGRSKNGPEHMDCDAVAAQEAKSATHAALGVTEELSRIKDLLQVMMIRDKFQVEPQQAPPRLDHPYQQQPQEHQNFRAHGRHPAYGRWNQSQFHSGHPGPGFPRPPMQPTQKYRWTPDNKPICAYCGFAGHTERVCRKKAAANPTNQHAGGPQQGSGRQHQNR